MAGIDVSYKNGFAVSVAVLLNFKTFNLIEVRRVKSRNQFPYIPTLLAFKEAPLIFKVFEKLYYKPSLLLIEGHGLAHPYACGLASHAGVVLRMPTIGVAKNLLCGTVADYLNGRADIFFNEKIVGKAILIDLKSKPIYVSVGNMISLEQAVDITVKTILKGRMPEPLRLAHKFAKLDRNE